MARLNMLRLEISQVGSQPYRVVGAVVHPGPHPAHRETRGFFVRGIRV